MLPSAWDFQEGDTESPGDIADTKGDDAAGDSDTGTTGANTGTTGANTDTEGSKPDAVTSTCESDQDCDDKNPCSQDICLIDGTRTTRSKAKCVGFAGVLPLISNKKDCDHSLSLLGPGSKIFIQGKP
jgi:hypothetical protein